MHKRTVKYIKHTCKSAKVYHKKQQQDKTGDNFERIIIYRKPKESRCHLIQAGRENIYAGQLDYFVLILHAESCSYNRDMQNHQFTIHSNKWKDATKSTVDKAEHNISTSSVI